MNYNVAQLLKEPVGSTRTFRVSETVLIEDGATQISPQGRLSFLRTDRGIWVSARFEVGVSVACSRCLNKFPYPMPIAIDEEYLSVVDITTGQPLSVSEKAEDSFTIDQRHVLDLTEALRQYIITNQPMKPLCSQECQGLCPICGTDRAKYACSCLEGIIDPRWSPLLDLLQGTRP